MVRHQYAKPNRVIADTVRVTCGNGLYDNNLWSVAQFEEAAAIWLCADEPECNGLRFAYSPKGKRAREFLVYNQQLWDVTDDEPVALKTKRLRLSKLGRIENVTSSD